MTDQKMQLWSLSDHKCTLSESLHSLQNYFSYNLELWLCFAVVKTMVLDILIAVAFFIFFKKY